MDVLDFKVQDRLQRCKIIINYPNNSLSFKSNVHSGYTDVNHTTNMKTSFTGQVINRTNRTKSYTTKSTVLPSTQLGNVNYGFITWIFLLFFNQFFFYTLTFVVVKFFFYIFVCFFET